MYVCFYSFKTTRRTIIKLGTIDHHPKVFFFESVWARLSCTKPLRFFWHCCYIVTGHPWCRLFQFFRKVTNGSWFDFLFHTGRWYRCRGVSSPTSIEEIWSCLHLILNGWGNAIYSIVICVLEGEILELGNFGAYVGLDYCLCSSAIGSVF